MADPNKCDFCSNTNPTTRYRAMTFEVQPAVLTFDAKGNPKTLEMLSDNDWAACDTCANLIDVGAWDELAERGYAIFGHQMPVPKELGLHIIKDLHRQFRAHRFFKVSGDWTGQGGSPVS